MCAPIIIKKIGGQMFIPNNSVPSFRAGKLLRTGYKPTNKLGTWKLKVSPSGLGLPKEDPVGNSAPSHKLFLTKNTRNQFGHSLLHQNTWIQTRWKVHHQNVKIGSKSRNWHHIILPSCCFLFPIQSDFPRQQEAPGNVMNDILTVSDPKT